MNRLAHAWKSLLQWGAPLVLASSLFVVPAISQVAPDNTRANKGDAEKGSITADQQKMNPTDRNLARTIRPSIMKDRSLSTYVHNVKIIAQDGKVTLKGPVRSEQEKIMVEGKAAAIAGNSSMNSEITVAPPKS